MDTEIINAYQSPDYRESFKYNHSLFWRIVKTCLVLAGIFFTIDMLMYIRFSQQTVGDNNGDVIRFVSNFRWDMIKRAMQGTDDE